jgi:putative ABC transport system ATP-binding protein
MDAIVSDLPLAATPGSGPGAASDSLIAVRDLSFTVTSAAGEVNILKGVTFSVAAGEAVGIVGPSGSGKSTLMMLMGGLDRATSGSIRVAGNDLTRMDEDGLARFRRDHVGIVFQAFHLVPTMTAAENVALPLEFGGGADALPRAREALARVGLGHRTTHYPAQLSGGEQQRVALARAIVARPAIILADEPTGNLDGATGSSVMDLLFGIRAELGTTLLLITHDHTLAERCGRVISIADGRIASDRVIG